MGAKVLVIGSGGREHALAWALSRSAGVEQLFIAPGNGGTTWAQSDGAGLKPAAPCTPVNLSSDNFPALIAFARENDIALTVAGAEQPLVDGIVDAFEAEGLRIFGPRAAAAQLEGSKAFSKAFMDAFNIPTAAYGRFTDYDSAQAYLKTCVHPVVVKASGLAAGKGVLVCSDAQEAEAALQSVMQDRAFGAAGDEVIIEERLEGREISVLAFCDGVRAVPMILARDHKRALDGDEGPNTGGMGAFAPVTDVSPAQLAEIQTRVLDAAVAGMQAQGCPYVGVLYAGLMLTEKGIQTLEFNCRFGDPETQVILPLLETSLFDVMNACIDGRLDSVPLTWKDAAAVTVVAASPGYPGDYPRGLVIHGLNAVADAPESIVFHAGTAQQDGQLVTSGGRVLAVTAVGPDFATARSHAYAALAQITFEGMHFRRDIGG